MSEIKVGVPVFYKRTMEWVKPLVVGVTWVSFVDSRCVAAKDDIGLFTYSPVIPPRPEPEVEWVEETVAVRYYGCDRLAPHFRDCNIHFKCHTYPPDDAKDFVLHYRIPKREGE